MDDKNKHAQQAIYARALAASVFLVEPNESLDLSSGTLIQTPGKNIVVLTAAHCLEEYDRYPERVLLGFSKQGEPTAGLVREWHAHPELDVGLIVLSRYPDTFRERAWIPEAHDPHLDPTRDDLLVTGFPRGAQVRRRQWIGLGSYQYWTSAEHLVVLEDARWRTPWTQGEAVDHGVSDLAPEHLRNQQLAKLEQQQGQVIDLPHPKGMSGGGCWRVVAAPRSTGAIWHPGRNLHLAAVQSTYKEPHIYLEPRARWGSWFTEVLEDVDGR